ncbi:hypothetical protein GE09DRAFT_561454 [Coniochaeta sp. 2T2.1]|nr:hypothetical protein GE09DRAFT_561454 [Coniochaeta sp. 2T2.1]
MPGTNVTVTIYERDGKHVMQMVATGEAPRCGARFNGEEIVFSSNTMRKHFINHFRPLKSDQGIRVTLELFDIPADQAVPLHQATNIGPNVAFSYIKRSIPKIVKVFDIINTMSISEATTQLSRAIDPDNPRHWSMNQLMAAMGEFVMRDDFFAAERAHSAFLRTAYERFRTAMRDFIFACASGADNAILRPAYDNARSAARDFVFAYDHHFRSEDEGGEVMCAQHHAPRNAGKSMIDGRTANRDAKAKDEEDKAGSDSGAKVKAEDEDVDDGWTLSEDMDIEDEPKIKQENF